MLNVYSVEIQIRADSVSTLYQCTILMKKALRETQTLRAGCSKVETKLFAPPQTPSLGRGTAKI